MFMQLESKFLESEVSGAPANELLDESVCNTRAGSLLGTPTTHHTQLAAVALLVVNLSKNSYLILMLDIVINP